MSAQAYQVTRHYASCDEPGCNALGDQEYDSQDEAEEAADDHDEEFHQ